MIALITFLVSATRYYLTKEIKKKGFTLPGSWRAQLVNAGDSSWRHGGMNLRQLVHCIQYFGSLK